METVTRSLIDTRLGTGAKVHVIALPRPYCKGLSVFQSKLHPVNADTVSVGIYSAVKYIIVADIISHRSPRLPPILFDVVDAVAVGIDSSDKTNDKFSSGQLLCRPYLSYLQSRTEQRYDLINDPSELLGSYKLSQLADEACCKVLEPVIEIIAQIMQGRIIVYV